MLNTKTFFKPFLLLTVFSLGVFGFSGQAQAGNIYYVDDNACPGAGSGTVDSPYCKIQSAINVAGAGDTVLVKDGTYTDAVSCIEGGASCAVKVVRGGELSVV